MNVETCNVVFFLKNREDCTSDTFREKQVKIDIELEL